MSDSSIQKGTVNVEELSYERDQGDVIQVLDELEKEELHYDKPWYRVSHLLKLNLLLLIPMSSGALNGFDGALVNVLQIFSSWKTSMGDPSDSRLGAITSGPPIGYLMALWFARVFSDKYGRKPAFILGSIMTSIGTIIQACSNGYTCFFISRIIVGWGLSFYFISAPALLAELSFPSHRPNIVTLFNGNAYVGSIIATWVSYGTLGMTNSFQWRIPCFSQLLITVPHLVVVWFLPESPRFLVSINKISEARSILLKYHGGNDEIKAGDFVDFELAEIKSALEIEKETDQGSYGSFFKTKGNFHRFCICAFMGLLQYNVGLFALAYYLNPVLTAAGITSDRRQMLVAGCIVIFNCFTAYSPALFVDKVGRRKIFLINLSCLFIVYLIFVVLSGINTKTNYENPNLAKGIIAMIFLCSLFYNVGLLGMLLVYVTEILPFTLRSSGIMVYVITGQLSVIFNGFITPIAMSAIEWKFYIVYSCTTVCAFVFIYFLFPETKGYYLEEVAWVFDGKPTESKIEEDGFELHKLD